MPLQAYGNGVRSWLTGKSPRLPGGDRATCSTSAPWMQSYLCDRGFPAFLHFHVQLGLVDILSEDCLYAVSIGARRGVKFSPLVDRGRYRRRVSRALCPPGSHRQGSDTDVNAIDRKPNRSTKSGRMWIELGDEYEKCRLDWSKHCIDCIVFHSMFTSPSLF